MSYADFGKRIGRSRLTVYRYTLPREHPDHRRPTPAGMRRIHAETGGLVTPNDFLDLDAGTKGEAAA